MQMLRPNDEGYNYSSFYEEKMMSTVTIDQLIEILQRAKIALGGNCVVMAAGDCGSNYAEIRSIHGENFHDNLILTLSEDWNPDRKPVEFLDIPKTSGE